MAIKANDRGGTGGEGGYLGTARVGYNDLDFFGKMEPPQTGNECKIFKILIFLQKFDAKFESVKEMQTS